jgi:hypothetical protein
VVNCENVVMIGLTDDAGANFKIRRQYPSHPVYPIINLLMYSAAGNMWTDPGNI